MNRWLGWTGDAGSRSRARSVGGNPPTVCLHAVFHAAWGRLYRVRASLPRDLRSSASPERRPLLGKRTSAFLCVLRRNDWLDQRVLAREPLVLAPAARFPNDLLTGGHRQWRIGRNLQGE